MSNNRKNEIIIKIQATKHQSEKLKVIQELVLSIIGKTTGIDWIISKIWNPSKDSVGHYVKFAAVDITPLWYKILDDDKKLPSNDPMFYMDGALLYMLLQASYEIAASDSILALLEDEVIALVVENSCLHVQVAKSCSVINGTKHYDLTNKVFLLPFEHEGQRMSFANRKNKLQDGKQLSSARWITPH